MMGDRVGKQLGNYILTQFLGKGGFAEVYMGKHIYLNTNAAIKALHVQLASSEQESFLKEARLIASLVHPNIVRVLDFGVQDGTPFLVMDYAPNGTMRQIHPRGTVLPLLTVVSYTKQIAEALQYAHNKKLIHRDVKPENLLVGANHEILLSDFGTALVVETIHNQSLHEMSGTVTYMAPEQIQGKPRPASDQYSLAVIVYEWLTGSPPFRGSFTELFTQHMFTAPSSLLEIAPSIPRDASMMVMTALSKDADKRFGSVKAFANALEQACLVEQPTVAQQPSSVLLKRLATVHETVGMPGAHPEMQSGANESLTRYSTVDDAALKFSPNSEPVSRDAMMTPVLPRPIPVTPPLAAQLPPASKRRISRRAVLLSLAGLVVTGAAAGELALNWPKTTTSSTTVKPKVTPTPSPSSIPTTQAKQLLIYRGHTNTVSGLAWSPDGHYILSGSADRSVRVWEASTGNESFSYTHPQPVRTVGWSPKGGYIASASRSHDVQVRQVTNTNAQLVYTYHGHTKSIGTIAWSPDGHRIASGSLDFTAQVWNALTGTSVTTYQGHTSEVLSVGWSPDGTYVASGSADNSVQVWNSMSDQMLFKYADYTKQVRAVAWSHNGKYIASAGADNTIQLIDVKARKHFKTFSNEYSQILALAWSPDDRYIVAGGHYTGIVQVWDVAAEQVISNYRGHSQNVDAVAWSFDGKMIVSGGQDNTAQVWSAP